MGREAERLTELFMAVRQSSLKRFRKVKTGDECWQPRSDILSFVDILKHLVDSDQWLLHYLKNKQIPEDAVISPGDVGSEDWSCLLAELERSGKQVAEFMGGLSDADLNSIIDAYFDSIIQESKGPGNTTQWWVIARGSIDHEIHHRGQLQILLRLRYEG